MAPAGVIQSRRGAAVIALSAVLAALAAVRPVHATPPPALADGGTGRVVEVVDGDTVRLADGRSVRLVGIQAPELNPGQPDVPAWPYARRARRRLRKLVGDERVHLGFGGLRRDRYGRYLAHLYVENGTWVQGAMVRAGMARVYSFKDNRALVDRLLTLERRARRAERGLWSHPRYRVRTPGETHDAVGTWQIVAGRVRAADMVDGRIYLNFGGDWRSDFTITVPPSAVSLFRRANLVPARLDGARVRVRGWVESHNGPQIEITHPAQLERLTP